MPDFGSIRPIDLTEDRKRELEAQMALAFEVLADAAYAINYSDNPADIRRLRDEHLKHNGTKEDPLRRYPGARRCIAGIRLIETEVLGGYIRTLSSLCCSFEEASKKDPPGLDFQECLDEAGWAIWDSMYTYNGRNRFTTFIFRAAKNRLTSLLRNHARSANAGRKVQKLRSKLRLLMATDGLRFEAALAQVVQEENLTDVMVVRLQNAMVNTSSLDANAKELSCTDDHAGSEEIELMWQAVRGADLTPIERRLVEAHLQGDRQFRKRMCEVICPETGNPYTRANLSQIFIRACVKIRECHTNPNKVAA